VGLKIYFPDLLLLKVSSVSRPEWREEEDGLGGREIDETAQ